MNAHPRVAPTYETDFAAWAERQAELLRAGRFAEIDIENISEEIESLSRSDKQAIGSHLEVILTHLLKWRYQPDARSSGWRGSIRNARLRIEQLVDDSPSLRREPSMRFARAYRAARLLAADETGLPQQIFPAECPFAIENVLDLDWLPD